MGHRHARGRETAPPARPYFLFFCVIAWSLLESPLLRWRRFHHSSFFAGASVEVAGVLVCGGNGALQQVFPHSGHYRPGDRHVAHLLQFLARHGVNLAALEVDAQHVMKVARAVLATEGTRLAKQERPHFLNGQTVLSFLEMKVRAPAARLGACFCVARSQSLTRCRAPPCVCAASTRVCSLGRKHAAVRRAYGEATRRERPQQQQPPAQEPGGG